MPPTYLSIGLDIRSKPGRERLIRGVMLDARLGCCRDLAGQIEWIGSQAIAIQNEEEEDRHLAGAFVALDTCLGPADTKTERRCLLEEASIQVVREELGSHDGRFEPTPVSDPLEWLA